MALKETTISTRLVTGFATVLALTLVLGVVSTRWMNSLAGASSNLLEHPFTVSLSTAYLRSDILGNQISLMQLVRSSDPQTIQRLAAAIEEKRATADREIAKVRERYLGDPQDVEQVTQSLARYRAVADQAIALAKAGKQGKAVDLVEKEATLLLAKTLSGEEQIAAYAASRAGRLSYESNLLAARAVRTTVVSFLSLFGLSLLVAVLITRSIGAALKVAAATIDGLVRHGEAKGLAFESVAAGDLNAQIPSTEPLRLDLAKQPKDALGDLMKGIVALSGIQASLDSSFGRMTGSLRRFREEEQLNQWLKTGLIEVDGLLRGDQPFAQLTGRVLNFLAGYLEAGAGALYIFRHQDQQLELAASYAAAGRNQPAQRIALGQGLVGQAAKEGKEIILGEIPRDFFPIESALGAAAPGIIAVMPFAHDGVLVGALELAAFRPFTPVETAFLKQAGEVLAIGIGVNLARQRVDELLIQSQTQEEELRVQQEELQQSNEELEERTHLLEQQREEVRAKSREVERVSTYKSEFLANMSHELRTPLNSLMILSGILKENADHNLTDRQVEFAATIQSSGKDLLNLINDILDLSKIEAGRMEFTLEEASPRLIFDYIGQMFRPQAEQKGLGFTISLAEGTPALIRTDLPRSQQILKNLVANAIKFTQKGSVTLRAYTPASKENPLPVPAVAFKVSDTGIGVPKGKEEAVFQAFQQADGTTSRKFGGTGLGLTISRQLARGLHGEILLSSEEGVGTEVTLFLPVAGAAPGARALPPPEPILQAGFRPGPASLPPAPLADDREGLQPGERAILLVEDDLEFAKGLVEMVRTRGFKVVTAADGPTGLALAEAIQPSAIILDIMLPGMDGWEVMQGLAQSQRTRHIPVHFLSCLEGRQRAMAMGAIGFVTKPVTHGEMETVLDTIEDTVTHLVKKLLIVEDDQKEAQSLVALLQDREIETRVAGTGAEAIALLTGEPFDGIVLDLGLSDMSGFDLLEHLQALDPKRRVPVIVHSGRDISREEENQLQRYAQSIIIKGAKSPERLLNEVTLFLHVVEKNLPPEKQRMIRSAMAGETVFQGKKVLIVDDDMRNVFALSSLLSERGMTILEAENGKEALSRLDQHPDTQVVLMDIMMPEMDGYQAIQAIRADSRFDRLPVIALTAKAMKGDREASLKAGASDYISKPVDQDRLLSLLRVWLYPSA